MKTLACVVFELEESERIEDFIVKLKEIGSVKTSKINRQPVGWQDKLKAILSTFGVTSSCGGYKLMFYVVKAVSKKPAAFMKDIYEEVAKACNEDSTSVESEIRYVIYKILKYNSSKKVNEVLGIPNDANIKLTPNKLIRYLSSILF